MAQHIKKNTKPSKWAVWGRAWIKAYRYCNWNPPVGHELKYKNRLENVTSPSKFKDWPYSDRECARRVRQAKALVTKQEARLRLAS